jgi:hypothetical protein
LARPGQQPNPELPSHKFLWVKLASRDFPELLEHLIPQRGQINKNSVETPWF